MYILFPGRHHLLTSFQFSYLKRIIDTKLEGVLDVDGKSFPKTEISGLIFAVTSANHSNTRRNPVPFYLRAMGLQSFSTSLQIPSYIYGIDDVGHLDNFALYTIKKIRHESDELFDLSPANTVVLCSTPVLEMYAQLGFRILPAELESRETYKMKTENPWDLVELIARSSDWEMDQALLAKIHPSSVNLWKEYRLGSKAKMLFSDRMIGDDGDITSTRDYNSYVRQMDEIAGLKYDDTASFIQSGRIGDIGCSAGSWIKLACQDIRYRESDFYGIEVARHLYDLCLQRKHNGDFNNPFVFFSKKNAVMDLVFDQTSMNTIHTSSLTHEIVSYGSQADLLQFISNRYRELVPGGVWINRDVVGPEDKESMVLMRLCMNDGRSDDYEQQIGDRSVLAQYLKGLSTFGKFMRFARDFRKSEKYRLDFEVKRVGNDDLIRLRLKDACEFMSKKDYVDNWQSEMHETFCFWSYSDWLQAMQKVGFVIQAGSTAYLNSWIFEERYLGKVELFTDQEGKLKQLPFPVTNILLVAKKAL